MTRLLSLLTSLLAIAVVSAGVAVAAGYGGGDPPLRLQGHLEAQPGVAPLQGPRGDQGRERCLPHRPGRGRRGAAIFHYVGDNTICYGFTLRDAATPTVAHIHKGKAGRNGDPVITFANVPKDKAGQRSGDPGASSGCNTLTEPSEIAALRRIKAHPQRYYVNFHTTEFPKGAVRGQLVRVLFDND